MCEQCWKDNGSLAIVNDRTLRAARLIRQIYKGYPSGGAMHVVIDDWNLDDDDIDWTDRELLTQPWAPEPADVPLFRECITALRECSMDERWSAVAIEEGIVAGMEAN